jgi:membrane fusion protein, multidrug efflux system
MARRMITMLVVVGAAIGVLGMYKVHQIRAAMAGNASFQPAPEAVTTVVADTATWSGTISGIGTVRAVQGVTVSADMPGIIERISFESGEPVRNGQVLVVLDARQEKAQLAAAKSRLELAKLQLERFAGLRQKGVASQAEYDSAAAESTQAEARVGEIEATLDRKTIRAPFTGLLGIRQVNVGQYLKAGDPVVPLQLLDPIYVDFSVPQRQIQEVAAGTPVAAIIEDGVEVEGKVTAVDSVIDSSTRNIQVQATFANGDATMRPGMFVEVRVETGDSSTVIALPASAISYAPYGDSVFVVEDMEGKDGSSYRGVRQQFVQLGASRGDQIAVLGGIEPGDEIVTSGVFKLRTGAAVMVNNDIQPGNDPEPSPENS